MRPIRRRAASTKKSILERALRRGSPLSFGPPRITEQTRKAWLSRHGECAEIGATLWGHVLPVGIRFSWHRYALTECPLAASRRRGPSKNGARLKLMSHSRTRAMLIALLNPINNLPTSGHGRLRDHARVAASIFSLRGGSSEQIIRSLQDSAISSHARFSSASIDLSAMRRHTAKLTR